MNRNGFVVLDQEKWRIVKSVYLEKNIGNRRVWADLIYSRDVTLSYHWTTKRTQSKSGLFYDIIKEFREDDFDKLLLQAVRRDYPNAVFKSYDVWTDMDVDCLKKLYQWQKKESAILCFEPDLSGIDFNAFPMGISFKTFPIELDLYTPCEDFRQFFMSEVFKLSYDRTKEEDVIVFVNDIKPSIHSFEEIIR